MVEAPSSTAAPNEPGSASLIHDDSLPETGVRKVRAPEPEGSHKQVRWGAVIAGLLLAVATQILLGLLGFVEAWYALMGAGVTLLAGLAGGALGAVWSGRRGHPSGERARHNDERLDAVRRLREEAREVMHREQRDELRR